MAGIAVIHYSRKAKKEEEEIRDLKRRVERATIGTLTKRNTAIIERFNKHPEAVIGDLRRHLAYGTFFQVEMDDQWYDVNDETDAALRQAVEDGAHLDAPVRHGKYEYDLVGMVQVKV